MRSRSSSTAPSAWDHTTAEGAYAVRLGAAATVGRVEGRETSKGTSLLSRCNDLLGSRCDQAGLVDLDQVPAVDGDHAKTCDGSAVSWRCIFVQIRPRGVEKAR